MSNNANKNAKWVYYEIQKNDNFILRKPYTITELYDSLCNSGTLSVGNVISLEIEPNIYAKCQITEWRDNDAMEIVLFDCVTCEEYVITYHYA